MTKKPIHEIRMGLIKACIWKNQTRFGDRHKITVSRIYRNGDIWKESSQFGRDDLLTLSKVVDLAHSWIYSESKMSPNDELQNNKDESNAFKGGQA